jgi:hypothetical protein
MDKRTFAREWIAVLICFGLAVMVYIFGLMLNIAEPETVVPVTIFLYAVRGAYRLTRWSVHTLRAGDQKPD